MDAQNQTQAGRRAPPLLGAKRRLRRKQDFDANYRAIFEASGCAMVVIDLDSIIQLANNRFIDLCDLTRDRIENKIKLTSLLDIEDRCEEIDSVPPSESQSSNAQFRERMSCLKRKDGSIPVHLSVRPIASTDLRVVSLTDVGSAVGAESHMLLHEHRSKSISEVTQEIVLVAEPNGSITLANSAALRAVGIPSLSTGWDHIYDWVSKNDYFRVREAIQHCLSGALSNKIIELEVLTATGNCRSIELSIVASPRRDKEPEILLIGRDVSDHKQIESQLRKDRSHLEQVLESADALIAFLDSDGRYTMINRRFADALGQKPEQIIGHKPEEFIPESTEISVRPRLQSMLEGKLVTFEEKITMPGLQTPHWYNGTFNPIFDSRGRVSAFVCVMLDITEQKEASDNRLQRERLDIARKLARTVAHEFRQPLTALRLISDLSQMNTDQTDFIARNFNKIPDLVEQMDDLVGRLIHVTNLQSKPYLHNMDILDLESTKGMNRKQ